MRKVAAILSIMLLLQLLGCGVSSDAPAETATASTDAANAEFVVELTPEPTTAPAEVSNFDELIAAMEGEAKVVELLNDVSGSFTGGRTRIEVSSSKELRLNGHSIAVNVTGEELCCAFYCSLGILLIVGEGTVSVMGDSLCGAACFAVGQNAMLKLKELTVSAEKLGSGWAVQLQGGNLYVVDCELLVSGAAISSSLFIGSGSSAILSGAVLNAALCSAVSDDWELTIYGAELQLGFLLTRPLNDCLADGVGCSPIEAVLESSYYGPVAIN